MFSEKGDRTDQLAAVSLLDVSMHRKLGYDPRLLLSSVFTPDDLKDLKIAAGDGINFSQRTRLSFARLYLQKDLFQIEQPTTLPPKIILQQVRKFLEPPDSYTSFPVDFEYSYYYLPDGDSRLDQSIGLPNLPLSVSPVIKALYLRRSVDREKSDSSWAEITFRFPQGFSGASRYGTSIITDKGIFILDDMGDLRALTGGEQRFIEKQEIEYDLSDGSDTSCLRFSFGKLRGELQLGKKLDPDYVKKMFGSTPSFVTQSMAGLSYGDHCGAIE